MNYEQKHQEDLDAAKDWLTIAKKDNNTVAIQILENLFPELSESEDEKIRKEIIFFFEQEIPQCSIEEHKEYMRKWIAWLENQGKTSWKPDKEEMDVLYGLAYITNKFDERKDEVITRLYQDLKREFFNSASFENMFPTNTITEFEKQGEQKPAENIETLMSLDEAIEHCKEKSCGNNTCALEHKQLEKWLTELKELKGHKTAWGEKDENMLSKLIKHFEWEDTEYRFTKEDCLEATNWLKFLKDRVQPQPKQEWSIEDSERLLRIHQFMWANRKGDTDEIYQQEQDADWLMTLTPQPKQPINTVWYNNMDDLIADAMIDEINKSNLFGSDKYNCIYWINSHREKNIEWSKEDEKMISLLIKIFEVNHPNEHFKVNPIGTINMEAISTKEIIDWLKSFKSRSNLYGKGYKDGYSAAKYNYWKPSEQQIMGMEIAINILTDKKFNIAANHLKSIYNDIKKL